MPIQLLQREESVERGLFFFQEGQYPIDNQSIEKATGIAFLVHEDGVVITCSHVLLHMNAFPGEVVTLHYVWRDTPVSIDAMVLDRGWHGPDWQSLIDHPSRGTRDWLRDSQFKPETFKEDCALLGLLPQTARWDYSRGSSLTRGSAPPAFLHVARCLPLGFPGYQHASNAPCTAWNVEYQEMAARCAPHSVAFRGQGLPGKDIRFDGKSIGPGHSGGPVWDDERRLVVGMIRGAGASDDAGSVIAVDSRWISSITESQIHLDFEAEQLRQHCHQVAQRSAALSYLSLLQSALPTKLLPLRAVRLIRDQDALQRHSRQDSSEDALTAVVRTLGTAQAVLIVGGAGSGKSTFLYQLATHLLSEVQDRSILPVLVSANAFLAAGCDVAQVLGATEEAAKQVRRSIRHNGLRVILLIDALDEVDIKKRGEVLTRVGSLGFSAKTVFSSRPFEDVLGTRFHEVPCFALQPLAEDQVQSLASQHLPDAEALERFRRQISDVAWEEAAPVPLQVVMALYAYQADVFDVTSPTDLTFVLCEHLVRAAFELGNPGENIGEENRFLAIARQAALRFIKGADTRAEFSVCAESIAAAGGLAGESWLKTASESGLVTFQGAGDDAPVVWPHRTVAEGLAAQAIADQATADGAIALQEFSDALRRQGRTFAVMILAALNRSVTGRPLAQLCIRRYLGNSVSDYKSTLTAVQILGSGISLDPDILDRFVGLLVVLLLMPPGQRVGTMTCAEVFYSDRLPDPVVIARRDHVRPHVLAFMNKRLRRRQKDIRLPVQISPREEMLLSRLEMMGHISVPIQTVKAIASVTSPGHHGRPAFPQGPSERVEEGAYAALILRTAIERLQSDATGFLSGLVQHSKEMPSATAEVVVTSYLQGLLSV